MTTNEAILRISDHIAAHKIGEYPHLKLAEALNMALAALRAQEERERNDPLTLEKLREMDGEPVWVVVENAFEPIVMCGLVEVSDESIWLTNNLGGRSMYGADDPFEEGVTVYRHKPEPPKGGKTNAT